MPSDIFRLESLSQIHAALGCEPPKHPLISVLHSSQLVPNPDLVNIKVSNEFYMIMLKDANCGMQYGRNYYDFNEGVLTFIGPNQVAAYESAEWESDGWVLFFHPDLIRQSNLGKNIGSYSFFNYEVHEALHLSEKEESILNDCVSKIEFELNQNIDAHSRGLFVSNIELLLNYCNRFYERQFNTRSEIHSDTVSSVEQLIKQYYDNGEQLKDGTVSIQYLANQVHLSANYLSDLLKKETGKNTKEHINQFIVEKAKSNLANSDKNVSEIAYDLGFNYPHYFSRMFKKETGMTPQEFRENQLN